MLKGERSVEPIYTVGQVCFPPSDSVRPSLFLSAPLCRSLCLPLFPPCLSVCLSVCLPVSVSCKCGTHEQVSKNFTLVLDGNVDVKAGTTQNIIVALRRFVRDTFPKLRKHVLAYTFTYTSTKTPDGTQAYTPKHGHNARAHARAHVRTYSCTQARTKARTH